VEEIQVTFEGRKRTVKVPEDFDKTNPNHREQLAQHFYKKDSESGLGALSDFFGTTAKAIKAGTIDPAGRAFNIAEEERDAGIKALKEAVSLFKSGKLPRGAFNTIIGSMRWLFSPVTGFGKAFAGEPIQEAVEGGLEYGGIDPNIGVRDIPVVGEQLADFGGDYSLAQFAGDTAALGLESVQPGSILKQLRDVPEHIRNYKTGAQDLAARETYDVGESATARAIEGDEAFVPRASVPLTRDIVTNPTFISRVKKAREEAGDDKQRLYKDVGAVMYEAIKSGELPLSSISRLTKDLDMEPEEFVKAWQTSIRESGQSLNLLSQAAKHMARDTSLPDGLRRSLDEASKEMAKSDKWSDKVWNTIRAVENFRRGMMVSQVKTSIRNAWSSLGRIAISSFDDATQSFFGGGKFSDSWNSIRADLSALPGVRNKELLNQILEGNPLTKDQLMYTSVNEADLLNRVSKAVNSLNVYQERAFRRYAFQSRLEKLAKNAGVNLEEMDPNKIPEQWLDNATQHALDMTFASSGGEAAKNIVKFYDQFPILYTVSNPFPRFTFANSIPFLVDHSPVGMLKAFSPSVVDDLAKGNSKQFAKAASRGLIGTTMLASAMDLRDKFGGEKWYELVVNNEDGTTTNIDVRPYAPMSVYLFMAQVIDDAKHPERPSTLTAGDFADVAIGLNRVEGTGLILADILRAGDIKSVGDISAKFGGGWLSAFTTPLAQVRDVAQAFTGDSALRDPRGDTAAENLLGPAIKNIPAAETMLPPRRSPLKRGVLEQEPIAGMPGGIGSQITGVNVTKKTPIQREVDRLSINYSTWNPRTGIKELDRLITPYMSRFVPAMDRIVQSEQYKKMGNEEKKVLLERMLGEFKSNAMNTVIGTSANGYSDGILAKENPELLKKYLLERNTSKTEEALLKKYGVNF
jgi:succinate dehydrogenase flavin-adding protein (antitoxin of CptAB toxin-antitoxin module)